MRLCCTYLALLVTGAVSYALAQTTSPKNPLGHGPEVVAEGHTIFNQTCTTCHGMDGSEGERAPALVGERRFFRLSEGALYDTVKHGIPGTGMPALNISDENIWKVVVFIRAMRSSASEVDVPGNVAHGKEVFFGKGSCAKCHMLDGKGGTIGPDLSNIGAQITLKRLKESLTIAGPIPAGYQPVKVVTLKGQTIDGIAKNQDDFSIQLLDNQNHIHLLDRAELKSVNEPKTSLMPHNYDKVLSPDEYNDLLAMLAKQVTINLHRKIEGDGEVGR
ncbi:MAG TPA: c-type cytochrome [Edaphobacter sp.]|nr:c-type cytochrome [Edaphobacter sp.]